MIRSSYIAADLINIALKKAKMLDLSKYNLNLPLLIDQLNKAVLDTVIAHFELDKECYYESRPVAGGTNAKFGLTGSYDHSNNSITCDTINPPASVNDSGKTITFFIENGKGVVGIINNYNKNENKYQISLFDPIPSISVVYNISIMDWLIRGDVIPLLYPNELLSPENIDLFDVTNNENIEIVSYHEFNRRKKLQLYATSKSKWARYMQSRIEIAYGNNAPPTGTLRISGYWMPIKSYNLHSPIYISDKRIPEVELRLVSKLVSIKEGANLADTGTINTELSTLSLKTETDKEDIRKVR